MNNPRFQTGGTRLGGLCFSDYYEASHEKANTNPHDVIEQLNNLSTNRRDPAFTRLLTLLIYNDDALLDNILSLHPRQNTTPLNVSCGHIYGCQVLALMDDASEDNFDNETPPAMYIVLLFVRAFDKSWFGGHFNFRMRYTTLTLEKEPTDSCLRTALNTRM